MSARTRNGGRFRPMPVSTADPGTVLGTVLGAIVIALYAPTLGRGFVSEDFLILRRFHEAQEAGRFFAMAWDHLTGPWLGIPLVSFYRPLASFFLQVEWALFGTFSAGYLVVHLALHLWNAFQVRDVLGRFLDDDPTPFPWIGAALFALYPLHPNTVVFVASFATLTAVSFVLLALRLFLAGGDRAALVSFAVALGCYEQAAVLPALLAAWALLVSNRRDDPRRHLPFWGMLLGYLLLRRLVLGHTVGGYETFRSRLGDPIALLESALSSLGRLLLPTYGPGLATGVSVAVVVGIGFGAVWLRFRRPSPKVDLSSTAGSAAFGLFCALVSLAPFSFVGIVPGNGRYAYLASAGLAITGATVLSAASRLRPGRPVRWTAIVAGLLLCLGYGLQLAEMSFLYGAAGTTGTELQRRLVERTEGQNGEPLFVVGAPRFLTLDGAPAAQVFHWGLADAAMPPFVSAENRRTVYPLPALGDRALASLAQKNDGRVLRLEGNRLRTIARIPAPATLEVEAPANPFGKIPLRPVPGFRDRLVVITRGSYHLEPLDPGASYVELPRRLLDSMALLYGEPDGEPSPVFWWIERRRASDDALTAAGPVYEITPSLP